MAQLDSPEILDALEALYTAALGSNCEQDGDEPAKLAVAQARSVLQNYGRLPAQAPKPAAQPTTGNVLVVTMGYFGRGDTVKEAAQKCHEAGSPRTLPASVIVADKPVRFVDALHVGYPAGVPTFQTDFKARTLGALLT